MLLRTILAATDGSDQAAKAVQIASDLAVRNGASLVIAHVINEDESLDALRRFAEAEHLSMAQISPRRILSIEATPHGPVPVQVGEQTAVDVSAARREIGQRVLREAQALAQERGADVVDCLLSEGDAAEQIVDEARDRGADAIVLGSRGLGKIKSAVVGSVSKKVCDRAECTSITVN